MGIHCKKAMQALGPAEKNFRLFQVQQMESQGTRRDHGKGPVRLDIKIDLEV